MYTQLTLAQLIAQAQDLMDDYGGVYWTAQEVTYAIYEALRVWGALTNYWRTRGTLTFSPADPSPFHDLSVELPLLRTRAWTLGQMTEEIQYLLLENASGIGGAGMSGQIPVSDILQAIQRARNQFVIDARLPLTAGVTPGVVTAPDGSLVYNQSSIFVHRLAWKDSSSGIWGNLWSQDQFAIDRGMYGWTLTPGLPVAYSESSLAPLQLQLAPAPVNAGDLEALEVESLEIDLTSSSSTFNIPDEWVHAVKYAALADLLSSEGMISDDLRATYAETRYKQAVDLVKDASTVIRAQANSIPCPLDSLAALDAGDSQWRNKSGAQPYALGVAWDIIAPAPANMTASVGIALDVVQTAPLPTGGQYIQLGYEDLPHILDYVTHLLTFKCGGTEFKESFAQYDSFMKAVADRKAINSAKVRYLSAVFETPEAESAVRPEAIPNA